MISTHRVLCTARCDHFFLAISGTEYWKAINLCQHLLILITWQVFGNLNLLETNVTVFYFQSVSNKINSACWFLFGFGEQLIFMYISWTCKKKRKWIAKIFLDSFYEWNCTAIVTWKMKPRVSQWVEILSELRCTIKLHVRW